MMSLTEGPEGRGSPPAGDRGSPEGPGAPPPQATRGGQRAPSRRALVLGLAAAAALGGYLVWHGATRFPPDSTPQGAYLRIVVAIGEARPRDCFAYLEDAAQHAAYSIRDYRKKARDRVAAAYPEPERSRLVEAYRAHAAAPDGADVWLEMAERRGWITRLRRDLSGAAKVETSADRATIETARGTRYGFRRRENGIWGLTLFTAELVAEAERAARDAEVVERAAADYERAR
jgi:hypothetical protein